MILKTISVLKNTRVLLFLLGKPCFYFQCVAVDHTKHVRNIYYARRDSAPTKKEGFRHCKSFRTTFDHAQCPMRPNREGGATHSIRNTRGLRDLRLAIQGRAAKV